MYGRTLEINEEPKSIPKGILFQKKIFHFAPLIFPFFSKVKGKKEGVKSNMLL